MPKRRRHGNQATTGRGRPAGTRRAVTSRIPEAPQDMLIAEREMAAGGAPFCRVDFKREGGARRVVQGALVAPMARHPMAGYPLGILRLRNLIDDDQHDAGLEFAWLYSMVYGIKRKTADALMGMAAGKIRREFLDEDEFWDKYHRKGDSPPVVRQRRLRAMRYTQSLVDLCVNEKLPVWITPQVTARYYTTERIFDFYAVRYPMRDGLVPSELVGIRVQLDNFRGIKRDDDAYFRVSMTHTTHYDASTSCGDKSDGTKCS